MIPLVALLTCAGAFVPAAAASETAIVTTPPGATTGGPEPARSTPDARLQSTDAASRSSRSHAAVHQPHPRGPALVGHPAPPFDLPRLTDGRVSSAQLRGKPLVLVVATTEGGAPPSKTWMLALEKNFRHTDTNLYQVVVLDNPWYLPHFVVRGRLRDFVPSFGYQMVLIEWGTGFGDAYGIPKDDQPRVVVIDRRGIVRYWHRGPMTDAALAQVLSLVANL